MCSSDLESLPVSGVARVTWKHAFVDDESPITQVQVCLLSASAQPPADSDATNATNASSATNATASFLTAMCNVTEFTDADTLDQGFADVEMPSALNSTEVAVAYVRVTNAAGHSASDLSNEADVILAPPSVEALAVNDFEEATADESPCILSGRGSVTVKWTAFGGTASTPLHFEVHLQANGTSTHLWPVERYDLLPGPGGIVRFRGLLDPVRVHQRRGRVLLLADSAAKWP